jgi:hypothetical protein
MFEACMPENMNQWVSSANQSAQKHQELVNAINSNRIGSVDGNLATYSTPGGRSILDLSRYTVVDRRLARVMVATGPGGGFTDARYELYILQHQRSDVGPGGGAGVGVPPGATNNVILDIEEREFMFPDGGYDNTVTNPAAGVDDPSIGYTVVGINLAEMTSLDSSDGTHNLTDLDGAFSEVIVEAFCITDDEDASQPHWFFHLVPKLPMMLAVNLTWHAGADGTQTDTCHYDYNATDAVSGDIISGGPFAYTANRELGSTKKATRGMILWQVDGTKTLWWCDEVANKKACP